MNNQWSSQNNFAHNKALLTNRAAGATHGRTAKPRSVGGKGGKQTTPDDHLEYLKAENDFAF